jgi:hypothetical protein
MLRFAIGTAAYKLLQSPSGSEITHARLGVKRSQVQVLSPRLEGGIPCAEAREMPELSRFYGVRITMTFVDHAPPHFHATYGEDEAQVEIATGEVIGGSLPRRAAALVKEWAELHRIGTRR